MVVQYTVLVFKYVQFYGDWKVWVPGQSPNPKKDPSYYYPPTAGAAYWALVANNSIYVVAEGPTGNNLTYWFDDVPMEQLVYVDRNVIHIPMLATSKNPGDKTSP